MLMIAGGAAALILLYFSSKNWKLSLKSVLVLIVVEGAIRKWILPQASDQVYLLKDVVLLGAYLHYMFSVARLHHKMRLTGFVFLIFLILVWCLAQSFNPYLGSPIAGIWGTKLYIYYIPILWLAPDLFASKEELKTFLQWYLLLIIPVALLGIVQFFSPASSPINVYAGGIENTAGFVASDNTRITATFSYLGGYSVYMMASIALLTPLLVAQQEERLWRYASFVELILIILTSFMTGSRSLILFEFFFLTQFIFFIGIKQPKQTIKLLRLITISTLILIAVILFTPLGAGFDAFLYRATHSDSASDRIFSDFFAVTDLLHQGQFAGYGTGATHPAVISLQKILRLPPGAFLPYAEGEMGRIMLEVGPVGFVLWYSLRIGLIFSLFQTFFFAKDKYLASAALAAFLFHAINLPGHLVFNHTFSVYFWFFSGFILLIPKLEQVQNPILTKKATVFSNESIKSFTYPG